VPLSDEEQRILREIEENLKTDERFAQKVSGTGSMYAGAIRTVKRAVFGLVVGLVGMVFALRVHFMLAFVVFAGMLALTLLIESQLRMLGKVGARDLAQNIRIPRPRRPGSDSD
jgi:hypothetical protein